MPRAGEKNKAWAGRVKRWALLRETGERICQGRLHLTAKRSGVKLRNRVLIHAGPVRDSASVATATSKQGTGEMMEAMIVKVDFH